jgi:small subunit ribosomal protein S27Ae
MSEVSERKEKAEEAEETLETVEAEKEKKPEKKKKKEKGVFALYKIENGGLVRLRPICERCGPGYFMADHGDRYACGHCGFTRYKPAENKK